MMGGCCYGGGGAPCPVPATTAATRLGMFQTLQNNYFDKQFSCLLANLRPTQAFYVLSHLAIIVIRLEDLDAVVIWCKMNWSLMDPG